jgi:hypothetical protein
MLPMEVPMEGCLLMEGEGLRKAWLCALASVRVVCASERFVSASSKAACVCYVNVSVCLFCMCVCVCSASFRAACVCVSVCVFVCVVYLL